MKRSALGLMEPECILNLRCPTLRLDRPPIPLVLVPLLIIVRVQTYNLLTRGLVRPFLIGIVWDWRLDRMAIYAFLIFINIILSIIVIVIPIVVECR
jgi:hypothetical protein